MTVRTGLDPLELAVLQGLRSVGALPHAPHRNNKHTLDAIERTFGFGQRYMFDVLCDLSREWECAVTLVDFHGNNGAAGYPAAPAYATESRLSRAGALALDIEESPTGAIPLRLINGTLYRGGTAPALPPRRILECLERLVADPQLEDQDIIEAIGAPHFFGDPVIGGDLNALYSGETVDCTLSAHLAVIGTSARGMKVSVTHFPPSVTSGVLVEELEHHTSEEAWRAFNEGYYESEPRLPISSVSHHSHGNFATGHHEVHIKVERGVDIDMFMEALSTHHLIREDISLAFPKPVATMMREWAREYGTDETLSNLAALEDLLPTGKSE